MDSDQTKLVAILRADAQTFGLDPDLVQAHAIVESNLNTFCCRYEPKWAYFFKVDEFAKNMGQSKDTEQVQQAISYGALQIMGSVARELGFFSYLSQLSLPAIGVRYGVLKLQEIAKKYGKLEERIAAFNAGSPRYNADGSFTNQSYVNRVMAELNKLKA